MYEVRDAGLGYTGIYMFSHGQWHCVCLVPGKQEKAEVICTILRMNHSASAALQDLFS